MMLTLLNYLGVGGKWYIFTREWGCAIGKRCDVNSVKLPNFFSIQLDKATRAMWRVMSMTHRSIRQFGLETWGVVEPTCKRSEGGGRVYSLGERGGVRGDVM